METEIKVVSMDDATFTQWQGIGEAEGLTSDLEVAKFLINMYAAHKDQTPRSASSSLCHLCSAPVTHPLCNTCTHTHPPTPQPPPPPPNHSSQPTPSQSPFSGRGTSASHSVHPPHAVTTSLVISHPQAGCSVSPECSQPPTSIVLTENGQSESRTNSSAESSQSRARATLSALESGKSGHLEGRARLFCPDVSMSEAKSRFSMLEIAQSSQTRREEPSSELGQLQTRTSSEFGQSKARSVLHESMQSQARIKLSPPELSQSQTAFSLLPHNSSESQANDRVADDESDMRGRTECNQSRQQDVAVLGTLPYLNQFMGTARLNRGCQPDQSSTGLSTLPQLAVGVTEENSIIGGADVGGGDDDDSETCVEKDSSYFQHDSSPGQHTDKLVSVMDNTAAFQTQTRPQHRQDGGDVGQRKRWGCHLYAPSASSSCAVPLLPSATTAGKDRPRLDQETTLPSPRTMRRELSNVITFDDVTTSCDDVTIQCDVTTLCVDVTTSSHNVTSACAKTASGDHTVRPSIAPTVNKTSIRRGKRRGVLSTAAGGSDSQPPGGRSGRAPGKCSRRSSCSGTAELQDSRGACSGQPKVSQQSPTPLRRSCRLGPRSSVPPPPLDKPDPSLDLGHHTKDTTFNLDPATLHSKGSEENRIKEEEVDEKNGSSSPAHYQKCLVRKDSDKSPSMAGIIMETAQQPTPFLLIGDDSEVKLMTLSPLMNNDFVSEKDDGEDVKLTPSTALKDGVCFFNNSTADDSKEKNSSNIDNNSSNNSNIHNSSSNNSSNICNSSSNNNSSNISNSNNSSNIHNCSNRNSSNINIDNSSNVSSSRNNSRNINRSNSSNVDCSSNNRNIDNNSSNNSRNIDNNSNSSCNVDSSSSRLSWHYLGVADVDIPDLNQERRRRNKSTRRSVGDRYQCKECSSSFTHRAVLVRHIRLSHLRWRPHGCNLCPATFANRTKLVRHVNVVHTKFRPFRCEVCGATFVDRCTLAAHRQTHSEQRRHCCFCELCGKGYYGMRELKRHMEIHAARPTRSLLCWVCGKAVRTTQYLRVHLRTHSPDKAFTCPLCAHVFTSKCSLHKHQASGACRKRLDRSRMQQSSNGHLCCSDGTTAIKRRVASLVCRKPKQKLDSFQCDLCQKFFSAKKNVYKHKRSIHGTEVQRESQERIVVKDPEQLAQYLTTKTHDPGALKFACDLCSKRYSSQESLRKHKNIVHLGRRDYRCSLCDKTFTRHTSVIEHKHNVHKVGGKPALPSAQCQICQKTFAAKNSLRKHLKTVHFGLLPHACGQCGKKFASRYHLREHAKTSGHASAPPPPLLKGTHGEEVEVSSSDSSQRDNPSSGGLSHGVPAHASPFTEISTDVCCDAVVDRQPPHPTFRTSLPPPWATPFLPSNSSSTSSSSSSGGITPVQGVPGMSGGGGGVLHTELSEQNVAASLPSDLWHTG